MRPSEENRLGEIRDRLLEKILVHVPFDGWGEKSLSLAIRDTGIDKADARLACPGGARDLALLFHRRGDEEMAQRLRGEKLGQLRVRDRVALAVWIRIEAAIPHREAARKSMALFSLPLNSALGAKALWDTADTIWSALGDPSEDINWYTKRAILSSVYGASALYWLGDSSAGFEDTKAFIDRRIDNVMKFEAVKSRVKATPLSKAFMRGPGRILDLVRAPGRCRTEGFPGREAQGKNR